MRNGDGAGVKTNAAQSRNTQSYLPSLHAQSRASTSQDEGQHIRDIEVLRESLQKATWIQEEDKAAEVRYERFLMLQSLSKSMTKYYQFEFGKNDKTSSLKFQ